MAAPRVALVIPVRNGEPFLERMLPALRAQRLQPDEILVIDSASRDRSVARWRAFGARVVEIDAATFNHGGTRGWASTLVDADVLVYLTQDAVPVPPDALANLVAGLYAEDGIGVAYGRQLPHPGAGVLARHARAFNYPAQGRIKRLADAAELGIKTCFSSDAFCAYRRDALDAVGGFPQDVIGSEDAHVAGRMLLAGYAVNYVADAQAWHSHDYSIAEEFRRYFDIGVFYSRERWIAERFGRAGGEGGRFVKSELAALRREGRLREVPGALLRSAAKLVGYRLGHLEHRLPSALKRRVSMFPGYWRQQ
ncbi:glycosyltransferase family 2 protein [Stenotrophomonas mori]|uniref:Glycosyltransferase family 2 protein n=1 Tax=Stenotrophomonas mori TaxID=2871096 RepID=A0ABT0SJQ7_9GAMM|nr:glycosyltransferase family A protein [Stenotrophomonas mori]MCL7715570.1 glycosyltransferase family 2 protein [Stenotrophomonas mori]